MSRLHSSFTLLLVVVLCLISVACGTKSRYTQVADLEDGPSTYQQKFRPYPYESLQQHLADDMPKDQPLREDDSPPTFFESPTEAMPRYSASDRRRHEAASRAAREYAQLYIQQVQQAAGIGNAKQQRTPSPPTAHDLSGFEVLTATQAKAKEGHQPPRPSTNAADPATYQFAEAGVFLEKEASVKKKSVPYPNPQKLTKTTKPGHESLIQQHATATSQSQTKAKTKTKAKSRTSTQFRARTSARDEKYDDAGSPPDWLVPGPDAKQGCPTTKPPPVPRMPPPPPPTPTPTWMSPIDEHNTPIFPQSTTPAPFYGMGEPPSGPPGNYLPLDTFLSPAPDGE